MRLAWSIKWDVQWGGSTLHACVCSTATSCFLLVRHQEFWTSGKQRPGTHRTLFNCFKTHCVTSADQCCLRMDVICLVSVEYVGLQLGHPYCKCMGPRETNSHLEDEVPRRDTAYTPLRSNASHLCPLYTGSYPLLRSISFCKILSLFIFLSLLVQTRLCWVVLFIKMSFQADILRTAA